MFSAFIALPSAALWSVIGEPSRWPEWNPAVAAVRLHGAAVVGGTGDYLPRHRLLGPVHGRVAPSFTITARVPERELTLEQPEPFGTMRLTWLLTPRAGGTEVTQRITFTGPSAAVARTVVGRFLEADIRVCFARLAQAAGLRPAADALTAVIAGGSGNLGRHVAADLVCRGVDVVILTRRAVPFALPFRQCEWDGRAVSSDPQAVHPGPWTESLANSGPTAVINLAGKLVDCPPTARNVRELTSSRVDSTRALVAAAAALRRPVDYWIQASTTAIWSDAGETHCDETTPLPVGLPQMTGVAEPWERACAGANTRRQIVLRTSIVLDRNAPALRRLRLLTLLGLGGRIGDGRQWFSWIHLEDWLTLVRAGIGLEPGVTLPDGILVAATDNPVRNRELMATLRRVLRRPPAPPTPAWLLRLAAVFLCTDPALALTGRHATSKILPGTGFAFRYPTLASALRNLC